MTPAPGPGADAVGLLPLELDAAQPLELAPGIAQRADTGLQASIGGDDHVVGPDDPDDVELVGRSPGADPDIPLVPERVDDDVVVPPWPRAVKEEVVRVGLDVDRATVGPQVQPLALGLQADPVPRDVHLHRGVGGADAHASVLRQRHQLMTAGTHSVRDAQPADRAPAGRPVVDVEPREAVRRKECDRSGGTEVETGGDATQDVKLRARRGVPDADLAVRLHAQALGPGGANRQGQRVRRPEKVGRRYGIAAQAPSVAHDTSLASRSMTENDRHYAWQPRSVKGLRR